MPLSQNYALKKNKKILGRHFHHLKEKLDNNIKILLYFINEKLYLHPPRLSLHSPFNEFFKDNAPLIKSLNSLFFFFTSLLFSP